jgi:hypothetical protein
MKKSSIIIALLITATTTLISQDKATNYIQMSVGYNPQYTYANSSSKNSLYYFSGELGKAFKWIDIGISFDYENGLYPYSSANDFAFTYQKDAGIYSSHSDDSFSGIINTAFRLNLNVNLIKLFSENSKHSFKVGGSYGVGFTEEINSNDENSDIISWWYHSSYNWYGAYKFLYEYNLTPNVSMGAFYNKGKAAVFGLIIKRKF